MKIFPFYFILFVLLISISKSIVEFQETKEPSQQFRAVWSTPLAGNLGDADIITFKSEEQFKQNMTYILDTLKMYNMNALLYHVRTNNDALYQSKLNPISIYFEKVDYKKFDPLKWLIDETHKRGIEFHAWMNPYRITSGTSIPIDDILKKYKNYKDNPASDRKYILKGIYSIIMDPGLEKVRTFIADTIIEFLNKYDVEAIHFDDYFYDDMGANGSTTGNYTILDEADQNTYIDYINNNPGCPYKNDSATDKANWRRYQVDLLIILLKEKISEYNKINSKYVQFGISPTGVYKNGDGKVTYDKNGTAITNGSETKAFQQHYGSYLFCDTLKWCNEGWIDYLLPQSYWASDNPYAPYEKLMDWWDKVLKYKNVNLYSGIGLYLADETRETFGWQTNYFELFNQLKFVSNSEVIDGESIFSFHILRSLRDGKQTNSSKQIENGIKAWNKKVPTPEIKAFNKIGLDAPQNVKFINSILTFDKVEGAKFYIIYRSKKEIKFINDEIIDMLGNPENKDKLEWKENNPGDYKYGLRAISYTNTLGNTTADIDYNPDPSDNTDHTDTSNSKKNAISLRGLCVLLLFLF